VSAAAGRRYTARGGPAVEAEIGALVAEAAARVAGHFAPDTYRALVLLGGYGRGEGGVERREGRERPHNNLDFLLITAGRATLGAAAAKRRLDGLLRPLARQSGVGIDTGAISALELRLAPCRVMWVDMRFGHQTVAGDPTFVPSLTRFREEDIEPADVRNLLVNRGSLLVINDAIRARGAAGPEVRRTLIKHTVKAVIGYGDALLFALGAYSWSYAEKQRRMRGRADVPAEFRALYDEAVEFRFQPAYERHLDRDPLRALPALRAQLAGVHLRCEATRLGAPGLTWEAYPRLALARELREAARSPLGLLRAARHLGGALRAGAPRLDTAGLEDLALAAAGPRARLAAAFPAVLYGAGGPAAAAEARRILGAPDASPEALRLAYLDRWGAHGDVNFSLAAHRAAAAEVRA
jgi:hypothetical protein